MRKLLDQKTIRKIDWLLLLNILALVCFGLLSLAAAMASPATGNEVTLSEKLANLNLNLVIRQAIWFVIGLVAMLIVMMIDYTALRDAAPIIYWINVVVLALLYLLATVTNNTVSWYRFGSVGFQPSELMKISLMLMLASMFASRPQEQKIDSFRELWKPALIVALPFLLVALQPDMGTAMVLVCVAAGILFVVGLGKKIVLSLAGGLAVCLPVAWLLLSDMQKNRILSFFDPSLDPTGIGYNVERSQIAIGSGQVTGKGMFAEGHLSQLSWVPVKESDFIFSVTGETFGFVGGCILILLFGCLLYRTLRIALRTRDRFGSIVVVGVASMIFIHVFENIGMTMGLMPVTGIPLPFVSYGGSNMLTNMISYGLVLNIGSRW